MAEVAKIGQPHDDGRAKVDAESDVICASHLAELAGRRPLQELYETDCRPL